MDDQQRQTIVELYRAHDEATAKLIAQFVGVTEGEVYAVLYEERQSLADEGEEA